MTLGAFSISGFISGYKPKIVYSIAGIGLKNTKKNEITAVAKYTKTDLPLSSSYAIRSISEAKIAEVISSTSTMAPRSKNTTLSALIIPKNAISLDFFIAYLHIQSRQISIEQISQMLHPIPCLWLGLP